MNLDWRGHKINLIDTPGTQDYVGEVAGAIRIADTAMVYSIPSTALKLRPIHFGKWQIVIQFPP